MFGAKKWRFVPNPVDESVNEELSDGVAVRDTVVVFIECKGTFIRFAEKYAGEPRSFFRGLTKTFGYSKHAGVYQLARAIDRIWFRGTANSDIPGLHGATEVFPVLVVQDPIFGCGPVGRVLSDRLTAALDRRRVSGRKAPKVWPLTILTADDIDHLSAAVRVSGARIDAFLKNYHRKNPSRLISIAEFFSVHGSDYFGPLEQVRMSMRERFEVTAQQTVERFRASEYGGTPADTPPTVAETA